MQINAERFRQDFDALAEIGRTPDEGVDRPALGEAHLAARAWFQEQARSTGLELRVDEAGNHSAFLACAPRGARTLLIGSHLDSVPQGGRYDGALGVLAALEILRTVQQAGLRLETNLEAIDFTDEEGTLVGLLGSAALAGKLGAEDLRAPRGGRQALEAGLRRAGLSEAGLLNAQRDPQSLAGYLELHIEQGPRLQAHGVDIGIVSGIVGIASYRLAFIGRADHAGTTPIDARQDASLGAAEFILAARKLLLESFPECTANVGQMQFHPGAFNIVPARAELALECRSADQEVFHRLEAALIETARVCAEQYDLQLGVEFLGSHSPQRMSAQVQAAIEASAAALGLSTARLASGAGHDAQMLAPFCPAGMIFIPSSGGSHSGREFARWEDCINGANVLLGAALRLAGYRKPST